MSRVVVASLAGAPGVSTWVSAAAAATTRPTLVAECPPAGGVFAARWGWPRGGLADLATTPDPDRGNGLDLWGAGRPWLGQSRLLAADPSAVTMRHCDAAGWLATRIGKAGFDVVVDAGRLNPDDTTLRLLGAVGRLWLVLDPTIEQIAAAAAWMPLLERTVTVEVLLAARHHRAGAGRYPAAEIGATLGWPVLSELVVDRRGAAVLAGTTSVPSWLLERLPLVRQAGSLLADLTTDTTGQDAGVGVAR